jgi:hypothetical protein
MKIVKLVNLYFIFLLLPFSTYGDLSKKFEDQNLKIVNESVLALKKDIHDTLQNYIDSGNFYLLIDSKYSSKIFYIILISENKIIQPYRLNQKFSSYPLDWKDNKLFCDEKISVLIPNIVGKSNQNNIYKFKANSSPLGEFPDSKGIWNTYFEIEPNKKKCFFQRHFSELSEQCEIFTFNEFINQFQGLEKNNINEKISEYIKSLKFNETNLDSCDVL